MIKILFVCHGNICRSTMAEFVMRDMVARAGLGDRIAIASCATTNDEIGNDTHPGTQRVLDAHGIAHPRRAAVKLRTADYAEYDLFIGMDDENIRDMRRILKGDPQGKVHKLLEYSDGGDADSGLIGQNVCLYGTCVPYCQSSQNGNGSLRWSSSQTALSPHSGLPSSCFRDAE